MSKLDEWYNMLYGASGQRIQLYDCMSGSIGTPSVCSGTQCGDTVTVPIKAFFPWWGDEEDQI